MKRALGAASLVSAMPAGAAVTASYPSNAALVKVLKDRSKGFN